MHERTRHALIARTNNRAHRCAPFGICAPDFDRLPGQCAPSDRCKIVVYYIAICIYLYARAGCWWPLACMRHILFGWLFLWKSNDDDDDWKWINALFVLVLRECVCVCRCVDGFVVICFLLLYSLIIAYLSLALKEELEHTIKAKRNRTK